MVARVRSVSERFTDAACSVRVGLVRSARYQIYELLPIRWLPTTLCPGKMPAGRRRSEAQDFSCARVYTLIRVTRRKPQNGHLTAPLSKSLSIFTPQMVTVLIGGKLCALCARSLASLLLMLMWPLHCDLCDCSVRAGTVFSKFDDRFTSIFLSKSKQRLRRHSNKGSPTKAVSLSRSKAARVTCDVS